MSRAVILSLPARYGFPLSGLPRSVSLFVPGAALALALGALLAYGLYETGGHFAYPLDDTYIHMAIAQTLAQSGVWGLDATEFVSGSSSMAWTIILATWFKLGGGDFGPLLVNIPLAFATVFVCDRIALRHGLSDALRLTTSLLVVLITPLPLLVAMGMEHCLQTLAFILFLSFAARYLATGEAWLATLGMIGLMTAIRPEGAFPALVLCLILIVRREIVAAVSAGAVAAAPIASFAAYSVWNGAYALPNSVLLKAGLVRPDDATFLATLSNAIPKLLNCGVIVAAAIVAVAVITQSAKDSRWYFAMLWLGTALLHTLVAPFGWLFRYEAYLVASGILVIGLNLDIIRSLHETLPRRHVLRVSLYLCTAFLVGQIASRPVAAHWFGAGSIRDRYLENVASAEFVKRYYDREAVLVNDIGAIAFFSNAKVLDLFGLGSNEPIAFQKSGDGYNAKDVDRWARHHDAKVALVKVEWSAMRALVPPGWKRVASWHLPRNLVFNDRELAFFASDDATAAELERNLREFQATAPTEVAVTFNR